MSISSSGKQVRHTDGDVKPTAAATFAPDDVEPESCRPASRWWNLRLVFNCPCLPAWELIADLQQVSSLRFPSRCWDTIRPSPALYSPCRDLLATTKATHRAPPSLSVPATTLDMTDFLSGWKSQPHPLRILCAPLCGSCIGLLTAPPVLRLWGRKRTLLLAYLCCCLPGSLLALFSPNMAALVCGLSIKSKAFPSIRKTQISRVGSRTVLTK